jgi:hypothetical protein
MKKVILIGTFCLAISAVQAQNKKVKQGKDNNENTLLEARRNHKQRIQEGIKSGKLTKKEVMELTNMEDKIKQAMYKAKNTSSQSLGVIDEQERDAIKIMLHELSNKIDELKNNADVR